MGIDLEPLRRQRDERRLDADQQNRDGAQRELGELELADVRQREDEEQEVRDEVGPRGREHELAGEAKADPPFALVPEPQEAPPVRAGQVGPQRPQPDQRAGAAPGAEQPRQRGEAGPYEDDGGHQEEDEPDDVEADGVGGVVAAYPDEARRSPDTP